MPEPWRAVYALNPMVGVVEGFRWALLGNAEAPQVTASRVGGRRLGPARRRPLLLPPDRTDVRGHGLSDGRHSTHDGFGKQYRLGAAAGVRTAAGIVVAGRGGAPLSWLRRPSAHAAAVEPHRRCLGAPRRRRSTIRAGEVVGVDRPQRRRQDHAAEDPVAHHRADDGTRGGPRPRRLAARGRHRLPPRAHRPRERLPQRRHPRHAPGRDRPQVRRDRRLRRASSSSSTRR